MKLGQWTRKRLWISAGVVVVVLTVAALIAIHIKPSQIKEDTHMNQTTPSNGTAPQVLLETSLGKITIELNPEKAPQTVTNFLQYVESGFFNETIFHRVIPGFMIQGGGFTLDMEQKETKAPVKNEADNGLSNTKGTIAMARTQVVDSATAQFFINTVDNPHLNHRTKSPEGFGYCVFGKVIEGMDVVAQIEKVPTTRVGYSSDVPSEPVVIISAKKLQ